MQRLCTSAAGTNFSEIRNPSSARDRSHGPGPTERSAVFGNAWKLQTASATRAPAIAALSYFCTAAPEIIGNGQRHSNPFRRQGPTVPALTGIHVPKPITNIDWSDKRGFLHKPWPTQDTAPTYFRAPTPAATEAGSRHKCILEPIWRSSLPVARHGTA